MNLFNLIKKASTFVLYSSIISSLVNSASLNQFIKALETVESGGNPAAIGDSGAAIGALQIHYPLWLDSKDKVGGSYQDCFKKNYSEKIAAAYFRRYFPQAVLAADYETLAKGWNAGPAWQRKPAAVQLRLNKYWHKVSLCMKADGLKN